MARDKSSQVFLISWSWVNSGLYSHFRNVKLFPLTHLWLEGFIQTVANYSKQEYVYRAQTLRVATIPRLLRFPEWSLT